MFPTPFEVLTEKHYKGEPNKYGDREDLWHPPVAQKVYGWDPPGPEEESFSANRDEIIHELNVYVPPGFDFSTEDFMTIQGERYRAVGGMRDYNHGPFGFMPGLVARVKRVEARG